MKQIQKGKKDSFLFFFTKQPALDKCCFQTIDETAEKNIIRDTESEAGGDRWPTNARMCVQGGEEEVVDGSLGAFRLQKGGRDK